MSIFASAVLCLGLGVTLGGDVADVPRTLFDIARESGGGANMNVPQRALSIDDVHRWARMLRASEAQLHFMELMYERFVEQHNSFIEETAPGYFALGRELAEMMREDMWSPHFQPLAKKVDDANIRIRRRLTSIEHEYIATIEPILTEEQRELVAALQREAMRRNCRVIPVFWRWGEIELREVWAEAIDAMAAPEERREVETILDEYEANLTALTCRLADAHVQVRRRIREPLSQAMKHPPRSGEAFRAQMSRIRRPYVEAAKGFRTLHEQTLARVTDALAEDVAEAFVQTAKEAAFPELYPDTVRIHDLFDRLVDDAELDEQLRAEVGELLTAYLIEYTAACRELEAFCVEYSDRILDNDPLAAPQFLRGEIQPLLEQRAELSADYRKRLAELVGPDTIERHLKERAAGEHESVDDGPRRPVIQSESAP